MRYLRRTILRAAALLAALVLPLGCAQAGEPVKHELVMAFVPSRDVNEIQLSADRIAGFLTQYSGYRIKAITVQNYAAVVIGMSNRNIDVAFLGPLDYVVGHLKNGAYPITASVRHGKKGYQGMIIARADSQIRTINDLRQRKVALGDQLSASSNLYPKAAMVAAGINPAIDIRPLTLSSASAIVISVLEGKVDAGAIYVDARKNPEVLARHPRAVEDTVVVHLTDLIPADPQIVRKDLNPEQVERLRNGLIALSADERGKRWLKDLFGIEQLVAASDAEYDRLRDVVRRTNPELLRP